MNPRLSNSLRVNPGRRRLGIVAMDFPDNGSDDLIQLIIQSNFAPGRMSWHMMLALIVVISLLGLSLFAGSSDGTKRCIDYLLGP